MGLATAGDTQPIYRRLRPPKRINQSSYRRKTRFGDAMAIDKSLKVKAGGTANRSVLTRVERIEKLRENGAFDEGSSPFGLQKVRVRKLTMKKKKKEKKDDEDK